MTLTDLGVLYALAGGVSGFVTYRAAPSRGRPALGAAALAVVLWPLWLPIALGAVKTRSRDEAEHDGPTEAALFEAHAVVRDGPLEGLLPREAVDRILGEVRRARARHAELVALLEDPAYDTDQAQARLERLVNEGASRRTLSSARLHLENVRRLRGLEDRDRRALGELEELIVALRTQLVLAKFAGAAPSDASDIVAEVWARVEVLGTTLDAPLATTTEFADAAAS